MNEIQNPYGEVSTTVPQRNASSMDVEAGRAIAEVQGMILMAKRFPRDPIKATDDILIECQRPGLAEVALYSYARGGTDISGPSIRLAEVIQRNWGNMEASVVELSQNNGKSEMMSYCWDIEKNVRNTKIFTVKHERYTKKGTYALSDPRDIYEQNSNLAARRLRAVILATIPGDVVEAAVAQCEATLKAKADTSPEAMKKMIDAFTQFNVTKQQIEKRIQRKIESITPAQVVSLRKVFNSLRDGMSSASDWFEIAESEVPDQSLKGADAAKDALKRHRRTKLEMDAAKQAEGGGQVDPPPGAQVTCPKTGELTFVSAFCDSGECPDRNGCPEVGGSEPGSEG